MTILTSTTLHQQKHHNAKLRNIKAKNKDFHYLKQIIYCVKCSYKLFIYLLCIILLVGLCLLSGQVDLVDLVHPEMRWW